MTVLPVVHSSGIEVLVRSEVVCHVIPISVVGLQEPELVKLIFGDGENSVSNDPLSVLLLKVRLHLLTTLPLTSALEDRKAFRIKFA